MDDFGNTAATAGVLQVGETLSATLFEATDVDWFAISLDADVRYEFSFQPEFVGRTTDQWTPEFNVVASDGMIIDQNTYVWWSSLPGGFYTFWGYTAQEDETLYLTVSHDQSDYWTPTEPRSYTVTAAIAPDDYVQDATTSGSVVVGGETQGVLNGKGDVDWLSVDLVAGESYFFEAEGVTSDLGILADSFLSLIDANGVLLASDDNRGFNNNAQIWDFTADETGTYFLSVEHPTGSFDGGYVVSADVMPIDDYDRTYLTTGRVEVDGPETTGQLDGNGDADWIAVSLVAGQRYNLDVALQDGEVGGTPTIRLKDSLSNIYVEGSSIWGFVPTETGEYYLDVQSTQSNLNQVAGYAVSVATTVDDFAADISTTGAITVGSSANGVFEGRGDIDWFAVSLDAGETYSFDTGSSNARNLTLLDSNGNTVPTGSLAGLNTNDIWEHTATTTGTYYLSVEGRFGIFEMPYEINANLTADVDDHADLAQDTQSTLVLNQVTAGALQGVTDTDWFRVGLQAGQSYNFDLDWLGSSFSGGELAVRLVNDAGVQVAYAENERFQETVRLFDVEISQTGSYFLEVVGIDPRYPDVGRYEITASGRADDYGQDAATSGSIAVDQVIEAQFEGTGDIDWFAVTLEANEVYFTLGTVVDSSGREVIENADRQIEITQTGTYYLTYEGRGTGSYSAYINQQTIYGTNDGDTIYGTTGSDYIRSGAGLRDFVYGEPAGTSFSRSDTHIFGAETSNGIVEADYLYNFSMGSVFSDGSRSSFGVDKILLEDGQTVASITGGGSSVVVTLSGDGDVIFISGRDLTTDASIFVEYGDGLGNPLVDGTGNNNTGGTDPVIDGNAINGTGNNDTLTGTAGDDVFQSGAGGRDFNYSLGGADTYVFGNETSNGVRELDYIYGFDAATQRLVIESGETVASVTGGAGGLAVTLAGDGDVVYIFGSGLSVDGLSVEYGAPSGGGTDPVIDGNPVVGTSNNDTLTGTAGDDVFESGAGARDFNYSLGGADAYAFGDETSNGVRELDYIYGFDGATQRLVIESGDTVASVTGGAGGLAVTLAGDGDVVYIFGSGLSVDGLTIQYGNATAPEGEPSARFDRSTYDTAQDGTGADDPLQGTSGNDWLDGNAGRDNIFGDAGDDYIIAGPGTDAWVRGGTGADVFQFGLGDDIVHIHDWEDGIDSINLVDGLSYGDLVRTVTTWSGNTSVHYTTTAGDKLSFVNVDAATIAEADFEASGNNGTATSEIIGTSGNDDLSGTAGPDTYISQGGAFDIMRGSAGADVFVFGAEVVNGVQERDQITNFDASEDSIQLVDGAVIRNVVTRDTGVSIYFEGDDLDAAYVLGDVTADTLVIV